MTIAGGCQWLIRKETKKRTSEHCNRLTAEGSAFCPKHHLMFREQDADESRRMEKVRAAKASKAALREALKTSPLRGHNPNFDQKRRTGYEA